MPPANAASASSPVAVPARDSSAVDLNSTAQLLGSSPRDLLIGASPRRAGPRSPPSTSIFSQALPVCPAIKEQAEEVLAEETDSIAEELIKVGLITHNLATALEISEPDAGTRERVATIINAYKDKLASRTSTHMGYPYNLDFDYGPLECLQKFMINNLGDPFIESNYGVHSREFEIGVLNWFAKLWEIERDEFWGYVTNCGTEGNLHGILVGRETLPDGILYSSVETHYSVFKAARMYRMDAVEIDTLESGEMDYGHFRAKLMENQDRPAIVNVNIGTTVRGAVDDVDKVLAILDECGFDESNFYIHCDGALFGMMIPFVKKAPKVSFKKPIGSVSVSGHKFVGAPVPCGVVMTRLNLIKSVSSDVEYLNSRDATIMGSRNGHAPIYLWYTLTMKGYSGIQKDVELCLTNAHRLMEMLEAAGIQTMLNELSSTVVFERPQEEAFVRKWQLACESDIAHVVVMPNISIEKLEMFVKELVESRERVKSKTCSEIHAH
mmetsp:Transcript_5014/g.14462  ORF Transcript_5014/g.14462 Transcript_5014/m.14462 type:complete len:496 (+) Transcript_5014:163-1650(+)